MAGAEVFSFEGLGDLLAHARACGRVMRLCDWDGGPGLILRHDVDFSVSAAYDVAMLEKAAGVVSSFFFLTTCPSYNPLAARNRGMIRELAALGFEVGLHFDPTVYPDDDEAQLECRVTREAEILESVSGTPVRSVSLHNPSVTGRYPLFERYRNAYDPGIFEGRYLSDSRMQFGTDVYSFAERAGREVVQLLLHPMHFSESGEGYPQLFWDYLVNLLATIEADWQDNSGFVESMTDTLLALVRGDRPAGAE